MRVARHAHITQNKKIAVSLQYIKKEVNDEIDFLYVNNHESSLEIDTMVFDEDGQIFQKFPKYQVCNVFTKSQHSQHFQHFKYQSFLQADTIFIDEHDHGFSKYSN